ncbi:PREDICTED: replication protein A 32 kDa subunit-B [Diuraphis noxia]|uniref:replication protein A 32 kDa subunit-B n=1 Tax=Diuraphis noxia TaxID=143948 RepID=UPI00076363E2|nr:PREDICTED: replication protein A 32 kDa subunit-B [Diuraphis noxia]
MWGDDEGGFNVTMTQSPATASGAEPKQNTVITVAIRELFDSNEENKNTHVVVVGIIKQVETQTLKNMFTIEDNTGRLLCIQWGDENELSRYPKLIENAYFKVVGSKRIQNDKVTLLCHSVRPLESLNELTHHLLSIIALPLITEEINMTSGTQQSIATNQKDFLISGDNANGFMDTTNNLSLNPKQLKVYTVIKRCQDEAGYSALDIQKILPEKIPLPEIEKILSFFIEEGHIFSTIDENHYKVTDFGS